MPDADRPADGGLTEAAGGELAPPLRNRGPMRPRIADWVLGAGVGLLIAVSPSSTKDPTASILMGGAAGVGTVTWRWWMRRRSSAAAVAAAPLFAPVPLRAWVALAAFVAAFAPTGLQLYRTWTMSVWHNSHGILIPPLVVFLAYKILRRETDPRPAASPWGFAFLIPGLLMTAIDSALRTYQLAAVGLVVSLPGLSLLLLGGARTRRLAAPLVVALFMIPIANTASSHVHLKSVTAWAVAPILAALNTPVLREGNRLILTSGDFVVGDACSGFSLVYSAVAISIVLAVHTRSWTRRIALLVACVPLAVACNIVRVTLMVGLAHFYDLSILDTPFHVGSGVAAFWGVLVLLFMLAGREALRNVVA